MFQGKLSKFTNLKPELTLYTRGTGPLFQDTGRFCLEKPMPFLGCHVVSSNHCRINIYIYVATCIYIYIYIFIHIISMIWNMVFTNPLIWTNSGTIYTIYPLMHPLIYIYIFFLYTYIYIFIFLETNSESR